MLRSLVEGKLVTNFLILEDKEDLSGQNLFVCFLENYLCDASVKKINLLCYENPPEYYLSSEKFANEKIVSYNYFLHPFKWNENSAPNTDLTVFLSSVKNLSETVFFIDSISTLIYYHGFYAVYRNLWALKKHSKQIICIAHGDLFSLSQLEELFSLATTYIKVLGFLSEKTEKEIVCEVTYHKVGGKVIKQKEVSSLKDRFKVTSRVFQAKVPVSSNPKGNIETLTTFKLGLFMSEKEKRARDELLLPYVKTQMQNKKEEVSHQHLVQDLEDDPDDDLDI